MIYNPNPNYYVTVLGKYAFVIKDKTGERIGMWKDGKYISFELMKRRKKWQKS